MSNEASVSISFRITNGNLNYVRNFSKQIDVAGTQGPVPGAVSYTNAAGGAVIDLTQLTQPALTVFRNLDSTNFIEVGIWDGATFWPLFELLPGEEYALRLSRNIGTTLRAKANTAAAVLDVASFEV